MKLLLKPLSWIKLAIVGMAATPMPAQSEALTATAPDDSLWAGWRVGV